MAELILPIYYVDIPDFGTSTTSGDELIQLVKGFQYQDWREIALNDAGYSGHRQAVHKLALTLKERAEEADTKPSAGPGARPSATLRPGEVPPRRDGDDSATQSDSDEPAADADDMPGTMDILAEGEEAILRLGETLQRVPPVFQELTGAAEEGGRRIESSDRQNKGFAGRLAAARRFAKEIAGPGEQINEISTEFLRDLLKVDPMVRELAALAGEQPEGAELDEFFTMVSEMISAAEEGLDSIDALADSIIDGTKWSKDMRKAAKPLISGLRQMTDARAIFRGWRPLVADALGRASTGQPSDPPA